VQDPEQADYDVAVRVHRSGYSPISFWVEMVFPSEHARLWVVVQLVLELFDRDHGQIVGEGRRRVARRGGGLPGNQVRDVVGDLGQDPGDMGVAGHLEGRAEGAQHPLDPGDPLLLALADHVVVALLPDLELLEHVIRKDNAGALPQGGVAVDADVKK